VRLPTYQDLSKEQDEINNLPLKGRWMVTGPPGTGKTVMARYRTEMIHNRKKSALLLMYNVLLLQYTRQAVESLGIKGTTETFHRWWWGFCRRQWGRTPPQIEPFVFDWEQIFELHRQKKVPKDSIPYLLIDEAQDLPKEFFFLAREMAAELTVFADENQRISAINSQLSEIRSAIRPDGQFELRRNYRNTKEIAEVAAHFYTGVATGKPDPPTRSGPPVELSAYPTTSDMTTRIANLAKTNRHMQLGVLLPTKKLVKRYVNSLKTKGVDAQFYFRVAGPDKKPQIDFDAPGVVVTTWASAKGLEFDTVFVPELQSDSFDLEKPTLKMELYVLSSRARERLQFSFTGEGRPPILKLFPTKLVDSL
jgi:DNA helicase IV